MLYSRHGKEISEAETTNRSHARPETRRPKNRRELARRGEKVFPKKETRRRMAEVTHDGVDHGNRGFDEP